MRLSTVNILIEQQQKKKASETFQRVENNHKKGVKMDTAIGLAS